METTSVHIPKFRSTTRLARWVQKNKYLGRLPPASERCFFRSKESPKKISDNLLLYSNWAGKLGEELEALFDATNHHLVNYCRAVHLKNEKPSSFVLSRMNEEMLVNASQFLGRLPEEHERRITQPHLASVYANFVGSVPSYLEDVIVEKADSSIEYIELLKKNSREVPERFMRALVGHVRHFHRLVRALGGPLPSYLLQSMTDPVVALNYARGYLRGRLPEEVEGNVFFNNPEMGAKYGLEVIRGFSNPRLPDALHNSIVLSASSDQSDEIRRYIAEVERCSEKPVSDGE